LKRMALRTREFVKEPSYKIFAVVSLPATFTITVARGLKDIQTIEQFTSDMYTYDRIVHSNKSSLTPPNFHPRQYFSLFQLIEQLSIHILNSNYLFVAKCVIFPQFENIHQLRRGDEFKINRSIRQSEGTVT
jgi:hypothetical protein